MNKIIFLFLVATLSQARAENPKSNNVDSEEGKMLVEIDANAISKKSLPKSKNAQIKWMKKNKAHKDHVPLKAQRDAVFEKVKGLNAILSKYDELAKDTLYIRARSANIAELKKDYPNFPEKSLSSLKDEIKKFETQ